MIESSRVVGNYTLGSLIGRGGSSEVYAAEHRFLGEAVAVKLLRAHLVGDAAASAAFVAEAVKTRAVVHPNVVQVLDAGADEVTGSCYLVMERVAGESLAARLSRVGSIDEPVARRMMAAVCRGMQAVHDRGIVHRDLKPGNVMLSDDLPKIVDFGIAKELGDEAGVTTGRRIGTPAYMAPEQLTGGLIAPCVDIWAVGVILFELVTGSLPFERFVAGRCPQLFEVAPRARSRAEISAQLDDLIARCLDRDPGKRPSSMAAIAEALEQHEAGDRITQDVGDLAPIATAPVHARPRRRGLVIAGAITTAAAIGGIAAMLWPVAAPVAVVQPVVPEPPITNPTPPNTLAPPVAPTPPAASTKPTKSTSPARPAQRFEVSVRSIPAGAAIVIDGKSRGVTPAPLTLREPTWIVLRRDGYRDARVRARRGGRLEVKLVKREGLN